MTARTLRALAWVTMALLVVWSSWRTQHAVSQVQEQQARSCAETNAARSLLRQLAADLVSIDGRIDDQDRQTLRLVDTRLGPKDCS